MPAEEAFSRRASHPFARVVLIVSRKWIFLSSFFGVENGMVLKNKSLDPVDPHAKVQEVSIAVWANLFMTLISLFVPSTGPLL